MIGSVHDFDMPALPVLALLITFRHQVAGHGDSNFSRSLIGPPFNEPEPDLAAEAVLVQCGSDSWTNMAFPAHGATFLMED